MCKGVGINAVVISGYTKKQGKVSPVSHAWVAVPLNDDWYFFDPTWGAGYVRNDQFVKKFNNIFYKMAPANFIADHMPFDPMYEFLSYPLNHNEFINGILGNNKSSFYYKDTLKQYDQLSSVQQSAAELRRLEAAGIQNDLLRQREVFLKNKLQSFASKNAFDEAGKIFTKALSVYKEYIVYKNKQFTAVGDNDLRQMIDSLEENVKLSRSLLSQAIPKTDAQQQAKINNLANIDHFWEQLDKEKQFVAKYFLTDKAARKQLFARRL